MLTLDNNSFLALSFADGVIKPIEGRQNTYQVTLANIANDAMYFRDRPTRKSGALSLDSLVSDLQGEIARDSKPNFVMQFVNSKGGQDYEMFTLDRIKTSGSGDKITGRAKLFSDPLSAGDFLTHYQKEPHSLTEAVIRDGTAIFTPASNKDSGSKENPVPTTSEKPIAYDFGFSSSQGRIRRIPGEKNLYEMEMKVEHPNVVYLSEFPYRKNGILSLDSFTSNWQGYGFTRVPPNAEVHVNANGSRLARGYSYPTTIEDIEYDADLGSARMEFRLLDYSKYGKSLNEAINTAKHALSFDSSSTFVDSVSYQYLPDPRQAINFKPNISQSLGLVRSLSIGPVTFAQDITSSFNPSTTNNTGITPATGIITGLTWSGNPLDPILVNLLVSTTNKQEAAVLANTGMTSPVDVSIDFSVYEPSLIGTGFFDAFSSLGPLKGVLYTSSGTLAYNIDLVPYSGIYIPQVYTLSLGISPMGIPQPLGVAYSATTSHTVQWG